MGIDEEIREIRNDVERIKQDIDSINRVQVLASSAVIIQDIRNTVGRSKLMTAILFLGKDWISSGELAKELGIDPSNLNKFVNPLIEKGLLYRERRGAKVYYKRATRLDLVGFEGVSDFRSLFDAWREGKEE